MRQIILDTETTGLDPTQGHRIIELGGVELLNRRLTGNRFQRYLNPDRRIDADSVRVHGLTNEFLNDKPRFADIVNEFLEFVRGAELIIHNAPFDVGFLNAELKDLAIAGRQGIRITDFCTVLDTLELARQRHPGQRNSLDALCKRYAVDNSQRSLHGALLDAEILAEVYLAMTREQVTLGLAGTSAVDPAGPVVNRQPRQRGPLSVQRASAEEIAGHERYLELLDKSSGGQCLWKKLTSPP